MLKGDSLLGGKICKVPQQDAINLTQYTISYQQHVIEMTDTAVPNIMAPLMLSFRRIIAVEL